MILLVFAHNIEAKRTIERVGATEMEGKTLYRWDRGHILICGIGPIGSAIQVARHLHLCDEVWNVGFAGGLRPELELGEFSWIGGVERYLSFPPETSDHAISLTRGHNQPLSLEGGSWKLVTSDYPIHHGRIRDELAEQYHVVDMEGYAIARAAQLAGKRCLLGKIVSDPALEGGWKSIQRHCEELSEELANRVQALS